jgi:hypothetical protein
VQLPSTKRHHAFMDDESLGTWFIDRFSGHSDRLKICPKIGRFMDHVTI